VFSPGSAASKLALSHNGKYSGKYSGKPIQVSQRFEPTGLFFFLLASALVEFGFFAQLAVTKDFGHEFLGFSDGYFGGSFQTAHDDFPC